MKLSLAPIQGSTIASYRNLYAEIFGGIDEYYSPFISTTSEDAFSLSYFKDLEKENNNSNIKLIPQLLGNNGTDFRLFASTIVDMGYSEINWNIGCPSNTVTKKKKGSGILAHPDMIKEFLDEVCLDDSYALTIKLRLGLSDISEGIKVIELLNDYPLKGLIIHARTGVQMYNGVVDLEAFKVLHSLSKHEVTYNGDIFSYDDFIRISSEIPKIKNFMLGRGGLRDPFLASTIKGNSISNDKKIEKVKLFHDEIFKYNKSVLSGDKHICDRMKEFWLFMSEHLDPSGKLIKKIKKSKTSAEYIATSNQILASNNVWRE